MPSCRLLNTSARALSQYRAENAGLYAALPPYKAFLLRPISPYAVITATPITSHFRSYSLGQVPTGVSFVLAVTQSTSLLRNVEVPPAI